MKQYLDTVANVLEHGTYKPNRTGVDTISDFSHQYTVDVSKDAYPLLTTKRMDGFRWESMIHELLWFITGEHHVRNLNEKTSIWDVDEWTDDNDNLETAYGRFWRRYPIPDAADQLDGEAWPDQSNDWVTVEETPDGDERLTYDQFQYVIDQLETNPHSRRIVVSAWHPANAGVSVLPPCHYTFVFNVQGDELNLHLTQRSADLALGVPFNIAEYSLLLIMMAQETGFDVGTFSHTLVDAHVYAGTGDRGDWYGNNLDALQQRVSDAREDGDFTNVVTWIKDNAPHATTDDRGHPYDHVPGLLTQLSRTPLDRPGITVADKPIDDITFDDIELVGYESHDGIGFAIAE